MESARDLLIALVSTAAAPRVDDTALWSSVDTLAEGHRLQPLLHALHGHDPAIPADIRARWKDVARLATLDSLEWQKVLAEALAVLDAAAIAPVIALKGVDLALHHYPARGQRLLRDLDLWVPEDRLIDAWDALVATGFRRLDPDRQVDPRDAAKLLHQLPALVSPDGQTVIELHWRLGEFDPAAPRNDLSDDPDFVADALCRPFLDQTLRVPSAEFQLLHLVEHARKHRFDNGPLTLSDIGYLLAACPDLDWAKVGRIAERHKLSGPLALLLLASTRAFPGAALPGWIADLDDDPATNQAIAAMLSLMTGEPAGRDSRQLDRLARNPVAAMARAVFPSRQSLDVHFGRRQSLAGLAERYLRHWSWLLTRRLPDLARQRRSGTSPLLAAEDIVAAYAPPAGDLQ